MHNFIGITLLNISIYVEERNKPNEEYIVLLSEVFGFTMLQVAAMVEFDYSAKSSHVPTFAEISQNIQQEELGGGHVIHKPLSSYYSSTHRIFPNRFNFRYI